jgi:NitT/TauT family transport system substrate-binding protein
MVEIMYTKINLAKSNNSKIEKILTNFIWLFLLTYSVLQADTKIKKIVVAGPFASVSHPVFHMIQNDSLKDVTEKVEFRLLKNIDELRALILQDKVDFAMLPTNTMAVLKNKGVNVKLLNVSVWGIMNIVSRDKNLKTLKDFKGKKIAIPFRADMPDIVLNQLLKKQNINPKKDLKLIYVNNPIDAMQMLIMRRVDHALLVEPATSMAFRKTNSFPISVIAPDLYRSVDIQKEWANTFKTTAQIPIAGVSVFNRVKDKHVINRFLQEYKKSLKWYKTHPKEAGKLVAKNINTLSADAVADSITHVNLKDINANDAKKKVEFFFNILKAENPKIIGGKLPNNSFYYKAN